MADLPPRKGGGPVRIDQCRWTKANGWGGQPLRLGAKPQLTFVFASRTLLQEGKLLKQVRAAYPESHLFGCSTAGEICGTEVTDDSVVVTAIEFEHTEVRSACLEMNSVASSYEAGEKLAARLPRENLAHVFVLSDGIEVNGSDLVRGLCHHLPAAVTVTGGLSGDGELFGETVVVCDDESQTSMVAIVGLYGDRLEVGYASLGGWDPFGPERMITRSKANVLYELDGKSALDLYKKYLGDEADDLPASGLLFPLAIRIDPGEPAVVRTILGVNEEDSSMTFAGDVPEGSLAQLMKANFDRLIDGAVGAAKRSRLGDEPVEFALLISCVGRKLVLKQRIEEEVEAVQGVLGDDVILTGFYSYGEISPFVTGAVCTLHNQTMTITTLREK